MLAKPEIGQHARTLTCRHTQTDTHRHKHTLTHTNTRLSTITLGWCSPHPQLLPAVPDTPICCLTPTTSPHFLTATVTPQPAISLFVPFVPSPSPLPPLWPALAACPPCLLTQTHRAILPAMGARGLRAVKRWSGRNRRAQ